MMTTPDKPPRYRTYLVSMWEERSDNGCTAQQWRFTLEDPWSGQRRAFVSMQGLVDGLVTQLESLLHDSKQ